MPFSHPRGGHDYTQQFRRSPSVDDMPSSIPLAPVTSSETSNINSAEFAAMQQLAHIVVSLRNEVRTVTLARDELETKLKSYQNSEGPNSAEIKLRVLEQENADLQADVDAFIAEQDDLKTELRELYEEKNMLNDIISRLKKESGVSSSNSRGSSGTASKTRVGGGTHHQDSFKKSELVRELDERIHFLTEENHKLESELQLLVNEKSQLLFSSDSRSCKIQQLQSTAKEVAVHNSEVLAEKDRIIHGLQEVIDSLKTKCERLEKMCEKKKSDVELLEGLLAQQNDELNNVQVVSAAELHKECEKATLVKERLTQAEEENKEMKDRSLAVGNIMLVLKKSVEDILKERNASQSEPGQFNRNRSGSISEQDIESTSIDFESQKQVLSEANNTIVMLNDELKDKDEELQKLSKNMASIQEELHQAEKTVTALNKYNTEIKSEYEEINNKINGMMIEKQNYLEEVNMLQNSMNKGVEEANASIERKLNQEVDALLNELNEVRRKSNGKVLALQKEISELQEGKEKLERDLDESSDAIIVLREALREMENGRISRDNMIRELQASIDEKEELMMREESNQSKLESERQVHLDTISALQKMIASLESTQEDLEEELNASSQELHELKDKLENENNLCAAFDLEEKLKKAYDESLKLSERVAELTSENKKMKNEVKALGNSLSKVTDANEAPSTAAATSSLVSSDPSASCDALISELKKQIKDIISARNAALKEVEMLRTDTVSLSEATIPPPCSAAVKHIGVTNNMEITKLSSYNAVPEFIKSDHDCDDPSTKTTANSSSPSNTGSRGSTLLEAAKKLCDQLEEKRLKEEAQKTLTSIPAESENSEMNGMISRDEVQIMNIEQDKDIVSANEIKDCSPTETVDNAEVNAKSSSSPTPLIKSRINIDQLTHIYLEKCGLSRLSDISTESSSFRRRYRNPTSSMSAKKVKICRNGVFMGTYEGDLNGDGQRHGFGVLLCDNGNSFEGEWKNDKRDGIGIARYSSGDVYDGQWHRGRRHGHGVMYIEAGDTYIGSWKNGLKHGAGTYHWADGEVDVSWYQDDVRVGEGVRWSANRLKAFRLLRGRKKEELALDEAFKTAETLGLNLENFDAGVP